MSDPTTRNVGAETPDQVPDPLRERALTSLRKKRDFRTHLLVYVLVNAATVVLWLLFGPHGFFWPVFLMAFWGVGLVMNAWDAYGDREPTEETIQREMDRMQHR